MALPLHAEISCVDDEAGSCRIHGERVALLSASHAEEITSLRQRIAELERQLAGHHGRTSMGNPVPAMTEPSTQPADVPTEGTDTSGKCVSHYSLTDARAATTSQHEVDDAAGDFASLFTADSSDADTAGWTSSEATFEERMAARAFFSSDGDESARRWLLED